jgi:hypothetical protein
MDLARAASLLGSQDWIFAKTMPENPHWYTRRSRWRDDNDFVEVVHFIRENGVIERYPPVNGHDYTVMVIAGFKYWTMGYPCNPGPYYPARDTILINRKPAMIGTGDNDNS